MLDPVCGGLNGGRLQSIAEQMPIVCRGLSLNLCGSTPLDEAFLHRLRQFTNNIRCCNKRLIYCADDGHLQDLMPNYQENERAVPGMSHRFCLNSRIMNGWNLPLHSTRTRSIELNPVAVRFLELIQADTGGQAITQILHMKDILPGVNKVQINA